MVGRQPPERGLAVFADPVLKSDDLRVKQTRSKTGDAPESAPSASGADGAYRDLARAVNESGLTSLERLRFARDEADGILALVGRKSCLKALDFAANRANATSPELAEYRIVHFATHGLINSRHPELSGLVLSLVNEQGKPQDGFLRAHEIYNLKLGASLVVLSGCQTSLGTEVTGEGLIGLARAFMYAGAPRVVASLWNVRDDATAELMKRFYRTMLLNGSSPAAALRSAQTSMGKERRWAAPYYWGGFVLHGEWK